MKIEWTDGPVPAPTVPEDATLASVTVTAPEDGRSLRERFYALAQSLGSAVIKAGASPADIVSLTITTPSPQQIRDDLAELDLLYRECLGGNMGRVGLIRGDALSFTVQTVSKPKPEGPVYRDYDAAALNFQYSPRAAVSEAAEIMASWRSDGTKYQAAHAREIIHSAKPKHNSDLYLPEAASPLPPLLVFIHGGYWQALDKRDNGFLCDSFVQNGIAVANLNYPLAPNASIGEILDLCRESITNLYRKAAVLGFDGNRITVSGHSAGGHLAAAIAATDWQSFGDDLPSDLIKAAIPLSGVFDLEPLRHTGLNNALQLSESEAASWSPATWSPDSQVPQLIAVGGAESDEFRRQSNDFYRFVQAAGVSTSYMEVSESNHFTILHEMTYSDSTLQKAMIRLVKDQLL